MVLETVNKRINVKDITLPEVKIESTDPRDKLTSNDHAIVLNLLSENRAESDSLGLKEMAYYKIMFPHRVQFSHMSAKEVRQVKKYFEGFRTYTPAEALMYCKIAFGKLPNSLSKSNIEHVKKDIEASKAIIMDHNYSGFLLTYIEDQVLFGEKDDKFELTEDVTNWISNDVWDSRSTWPGHIITPAKYAALLKILSPESDPREWNFEDKTISELDNYIDVKIKLFRENAPSSTADELPGFLESLFYLTVLASKKTTVTDTGFEIVMPDQKKQNTQQIPERRKF